MYQQDNRDAYFERKEEEKEARRDRWRLTMGLMEFLAVVAGVAVTLVLVLLIVSLLSWLRQDASATFDVILALFKEPHKRGDYAYENLLAIAV